MNEVTKWYMKEVYTWRTVAALTWSLTITPMLLLINVFLINFTLFHPISWITDSLFIFLRPSSWFYVAFILLICAAVNVFSWRHYSVVPQIETTRILIIWNVFRPDRSVLALGHSVAGALFTWSFVSLIGGKYSGLTMPCVVNEVETTCLNEYHAFIVFYGSYVGLLFGINFFHQGINYMTFPHVQQAKFFRVKNQILGLFSDSLMTVLRNGRWYYLIYFFFGQSLKFSLMNSLGINERDATPLHSFFGLLDFGLLLHVILLGTMIQSTWMLGILMFKIYNTEAFVFPIESSFSVQKNLCLEDALSSRNKLVRYLAFLDLSLLSKHSASRRKEIFSLSQPGGHPHNWNHVLHECLTVIKDLTNYVTIYNNKVLSGPLKPVSNEMSQSKLRSSNGSLSGSETLSSTHEPEKRDEKDKKINTTFLDKIYNKFKKKPIASYFFDEVPEFKRRKLFAESQLELWAIDALSTLVAASVSEDEYGVVQGSLTDVLTSLFALQEAVDKHFKLGTAAVRRPPKGSLDYGDTALHFALRAELKPAIYRITNIFNDHLCTLPISVEHSRKLSLFLDFKE